MGRQSLNRVSQRSPLRTWCRSSWTKPKLSENGSHTSRILNYARRVPARMALQKSRNLIDNFKENSALLESIVFSHLKFAKFSMLKSVSHLSWSFSRQIKKRFSMRDLWKLPRLRKHSLMRIMVIETIRSFLIIRMQRFKKEYLNFRIMTNQLLTSLYFKTYWSWPLTTWVLKLTRHSSIWVNSIGRIMQSFW